MFSNRDGLFQEDNATPYRSKIATAFHAEKDLHILFWPTQSLDFNLIENLWAEVKKNIYKQKKKSTNLAELEKYVQKEWKAILKCLIENLVDSMPERIQTVIAAEGGATKY